MQMQVIKYADLIMKHVSTIVRDTNFGWKIRILYTAYQEKFKLLTSSELNNLNDVLYRTSYLKKIYYKEQYVLGILRVTLHDITLDKLSRRSIRRIFYECKKPNRNPTSWVFKNPSLGWVTWVLENFHTRKKKSFSLIFLLVLSSVILLLIYT